MVRPTPPVAGQSNWAAPLLDAIDYATDQAELAIATKLEDVTYADLPAGVTLTVFWTGTTWPARPTSRTDIPVIWTGGTDAVPPPSAGFEGIDKWDKEVA